VTVCANTLRLLHAGQAEASSRVGEGGGSREVGRAKWEERCQWEESGQWVHRYVHGRWATLIERLFETERSRLCAIQTPCGKFGGAGSRIGVVVMDSVSSLLLVCCSQPPRPRRPRRWEQIILGKLGVMHSMGQQQPRTSDRFGQVSHEGFMTDVSPRTLTSHPHLPKVVGCAFSSQALDLVWSAPQARTRSRLQSCQVIRPPQDSLSP